MKFLRKYYAVILSLSVFVVYLFTLAPSVVEIDSGELATVQATLGIAHPTGYPLFTMIGYLFSLIPLPFSKIYQLNLLAAVWCSLGAGLFTYTSKMVLDNLDSFRKTAKKDTGKTNIKKGSVKKEKPGSVKINSMPENKKFIVSFLGGLILAFNRTYWMQSTSVEVYSLQIFLFILIIFFSLRAYIKQDNPAEFKLQNSWLLTAFALALGFSNHMSTLFILPGLAYLYFNKYKFTKNSFAGIGKMLLIFVPVLILIYLYLPIRASQNPILNWGNPTDFARFFRHVEANQYRVWMFSSVGSALSQLNYFITNLPSEFNIGLFICAVGLIAAYVRARKFFLFSLITFLFTVLYSINYSIHDIDSYFVLGYISLGFFAVFGIIQLFSLLKAQRHKYILPAGLIIIFIAVQACFNFNLVSQSDLYTFRDYSKDVLNNCSKNAVLITYQWDYLVSPSYYFQYTEKYRTDVTVVDKELLRRSWYYNQTARNHPELFMDMKQDVNNFLEAVAPFERGENFNPDFIEMRFRRVLTDLVAENIKNRDVYIAPELFENEMQKGEFALPNGYTLVPDLFMFKVEKDGTGYVPAKNPDFTLRLPAGNNRYAKLIENFVGSMLARRALYEMQYDKLERAKLYISKIINSLPDYRLPPGLADVIEK